MNDVKMKVRKVRKQGRRNERRKVESLERNNKQRKEERKQKNSNNFTSHSVFSALILQIYLCIIIGICLSQGRECIKWTNYDRYVNTSAKKLQAICA